MDVNEDLVGKTITGVIASVPRRGGPREVWLLQFSDGTHVEFVSPGSRRSLRRGAGRNRPRPSPATGDDQLTLNVA